MREAISVFLVPFIYNDFCENSATSYVKGTTTFGTENALNSYIKGSRKIDNGTEKPRGLFI